MRVLDNLLLQLMDGACAVDAQGRVISWNPACEDLLGVRAQGRRAACALAKCVSGAGAARRGIVFSPYNTWRR